MKVWMDVGKNSDNSTCRQYIDITKLNESVANISEVLSVIHAFSGCDYMAAFMWKGKVKFYDKMENSEEYKDLFKRYGQNHEITDDFVSKT